MNDLLVLNNQIKSEMKLICIKSDNYEINFNKEDIKLFKFKYRFIASTTYDLLKKHRININDFYNFLLNNLTRFIVSNVDITLFSLDNISKHNLIRKINRMYSKSNDTEINYYNSQFLQNHINYYNNLKIYLIEINPAIISYLNNFNDNKNSRFLTAVMNIFIDLNKNVGSISADDYVNNLFNKIIKEAEDDKLYENLGKSLKSQDLNNT